MNLETFKARARRKLALPGRNTETSAEPVQKPAASQHQANDMTPPKAPDSTPQQTAQAGADRFAAALSYAAQDADSVQDTPPPQTATDATSQTDSKLSPSPTSLQAITGSPASGPVSSDTQLAHLRSLLLGNQHQSQQDQVDSVYRRTQSGLNVLRRDMEARLTDLSQYVEQLEQSLLNGLEKQSGGLPDDAAQTLANHEQRLDRLDARVTDLLNNTTAKFDEQRAADREHLEAKLTAVTTRSDRMLNAVSERLESSIGNMQTAITTQLSAQSTSALNESAETISGLRTQLETLIDERVRAFNGEQTSSMSELRSAMLKHTSTIQSELQLQTKEQGEQLAAHRETLETQFNSAIMTLNGSKVSHKELSQLLSRLADRIKQL